MPFDVNKFVADYINRKYHRPCITVMEGCCRKCLKGSPSGYCVKKKPIEQLMKDGIIDPYQIASAFHNGSVHHAPYFKDIVINMKSEAKPCKYPGNCDLKCVLCHSLIVNSDDIELDIWPGFKVHKACTSPCLYPGCLRRLPTLPAYLSLQRSTLMCEVHKDSNAFHKLSISTATSIQECKESMSRLKPITTSIVAKRPPLYPVPKPTRLPQPLPEPRVVSSEPAVKKTHSFKKHLGKAKADKFDERGKSRNILNFFQSPRAAASKARKAAQEEALKASKRDDAIDTPRRFIKNKETGEVFGYWKGNHAYHIDTDEMLFTRDGNHECHASHGRPPKLDFSPPVQLLTEETQDTLDANDIDANGDQGPTVSTPKAASMTMDSDPTPPPPSTPGSLGEEKKDEGSSSP
jgi:hypothetical protein